MGGRDNAQKKQKGRDMGDYGRDMSIGAREEMAVPEEKRQGEEGEKRKLHEEREEVEIDACIGS